MSCLLIMPRQTQIKFKDFIKAIEKCAGQRFSKCNIISKKGSARRIELFRKTNDSIPCEMWVVHEDRYVYTKDFKKAYTKLGISEQAFLKIVNQ